MCNTAEFKAWHKREVWKKLGVLDAIEAAVQEGMDPRNLRLEIKQDDKWVQVPFDIPLDVNPDSLEATS